MNILDLFKNLSNEKEIVSQNDEILHNNWFADNFYDDEIIHESKDIKDNYQVTYYHNQFGFRIDGKKTNTKNYFYEKNKTTQKIACFGCSNTYGTGLFWDETWPAKLNKILGDNWICDNFGISGASMDEISKTIYRYTLYHKPDIICCFFPEIYRTEMYLDESQLEHGEFINMWHGALEDNSDLAKKIKNSKELIRVYEGFISETYAFNNFVKNFKFIESICQKNNIKLFWYTWSGEILDWGIRRIKTFLSLDNFLTDMLEYNTDDVEKFPPARDNAHLGIAYNHLLAQNFAKRILAYDQIKQTNKKLEEISNNIKNIKYKTNND